jgi:hypothetical protein
MPATEDSAAVAVELVFSQVANCAAVCESAGVARHTGNPDLEIVRRSSDTQRFTVLINHSDAEVEDVPPGGVVVHREDIS